VYRGTASAARAYVEADRSRVDDYYLAEGTGLARRFGAAPGVAVEDLGGLDGDGYEQWVAGRDPDTGIARGRLRQDGSAVRFVEITINGSKTWSLAAALDPEVAAAYEAAQDRAAEQIIAWVADHSTTRIGPRGRQVQVPVERIEAVTVRHYTSRAGDPHRHLHLQINARVYAEGKWRGLHTVGFRDSIEAMNGIGHAAVMTDPELRAALAGAGFTLDPASGEVRELAPYGGRFSERAAQIGRNVDRYEGEWRRANPGQEPGPVVRQSWDRRAWKEARPDKVVPSDGAAMVAHWVEQLHDLGYGDPSPQPGLPLVLGAPRVGELDRDVAVDAALSRLGLRRSAWNAADVRGEVERWLAATGLVTEAAARIELAEDITGRVIEACVPLLDQPGVPEHVRSLTSANVLGVEADIVARLACRAESTGRPVALSDEQFEGLERAQREAVAVLAGGAELMVIEGAAGAGKTTTLAATQGILASRGQRMLVVTPTLKAAQVASREVGSAGSVAWLVHQHGFRWNEDGRWTRVESTPGEEALLTEGELLLVDESAMLDQDTAKALLTVADEMGVRVALVGDRHQLPAVGRGGVLDLAARWVAAEAHADLDLVHRFADPEYAAISIALRTGSETYPVPRGSPGETSGERPGEAPGEHRGEERDVFAVLAERGQVRLYTSEAERTQALAEAAAELILTSGSERNSAHPGTLVIADTREQVAALNGAVRDRLVAAGYLDNTHAIVTTAGERLGVGDRVATRLNDPDLGVTNRAVWTVTGIGAGGSLILRGRRATDLHTLPSAYAREHVELAYATTVYGAQGETAGTGHLLLGEHTSAASAYVGMTRGRVDNVAHLVAENLEAAHQQWVDVFGRDRADLGPTVAAHRAAEDVERYGGQKPARPLDTVLAELWEAWSKQADLAERRLRLVAERDSLQQVAAITAGYARGRERLRAADDSATERWLQATRNVEDLDQALKTDHTDLQAQVWEAWHADLGQARNAVLVAQEGNGLLRRRSRQARETHDELAAFGAKWRPVLPDLPTDPVALATELTSVVSWLHTHRLNDAINTFVDAKVAAAHPDQAAIRAAERTAHRDHMITPQARANLDRAYYRELGPYRRSVIVTEPREQLASRIEELATVQGELTIVGARIAKLEGEAPLRALTTGGLDVERRAWRTDRTHQQEIARRESRERWPRQQEQRRREPTAPTYSTPDRGYGIDR